MSADRVEIEPGTPEWHDWRREGIGGSEAAACLGMHNYMTLVDLVQRKRGGPQPEQNDAMRIGKVLEAPMRIVYTQRTGRAITDEHCLTHPELPWMRATIDGWSMGETSADRWPVQIKTHSSRATVSGIYGDPPDGEIPDAEAVQVAHEMAVAGSDRAELMVLIAPSEVLRTLADMQEDGVDGGKIARYIDRLDVRIYDVRRDHELEREMIEAERAVYERYIAGDEVPTDIRIMRPEPTVRDALPEEEAALENLRQAWQAKELEAARYDACRARVEQIIGASEGIRGRAGKVLWRKPRATERKDVDWEAVATRVAEELGSAVGAETAARMFGAAVTAATTTIKANPSRRFVVPHAQWKEELL